MIYRALLIWSFLIHFHSSHAQFDTVFVKERIKICADSMAAGYKTRNWEHYVLYIHPALIGSMNGRENLIKYLKTAAENLPITAWKQYGPGKILQVVKTAGDIQAVVELRSVLEHEGQRITTITHLIGESWDGGYFWRFFDSDGDLAMAMIIKPDLSFDLKIPQKVEKVETIK